MWARCCSGCSPWCSRIRSATPKSTSCPVSSALVYALVAALGNVVGALAVTRRAARGLAVIEHFVEETHAVNRLAGSSALVGLLLHTFFDGVAIASAFLVRPALGTMVFIAIFLHKLPEGVTIASLYLAVGRSGAQAVGAAVSLGVATLLGVVVTDQLGFLVRHGLALAAGVTIYVAASNLVPEFQGKRGWKLPAAFFAGALVFFITRLALDRVG